MHYENWAVTKWKTPVTDVTRLRLVSLTDACSELVAVVEDAGLPERLRWRVRFKNYPAYRNIDEAYRVALWQQRPNGFEEWGATFTVAETPKHASWGTEYLDSMMPTVRHFVIATDDDVLEVLSNVEPEWKVADPATPGEPAVGKSRHLYTGEDDDEIKGVYRKLRDAGDSKDAS